MAIEPVNMDLALSSEIEAARAARNASLTSAQRTQLIARWGAAKVQYWQSIDSTKYQIDDSELDNARNLGYQNAKDTTGYNGNKNFTSIVDAAGAAATTASVAAGKWVTKKIRNKIVSEKGAKILATGKLTEKAADKALENAAEKGATKPVTEQAAKKVSAVVTILLASATMALYLANKPNKEQYEAIMELFRAESGEGLYVETQANLESAQADMVAATEETTALQEEAAYANEEANETIEENKVQMDFYKAQYEALIMKAHDAANGGEPLTADEKALLVKLAPILAEIVATIDVTNEEASKAVNEMYDNIIEYEMMYNTGAETIATAQGITDFGENFDETTKTMCKLEAIMQALNGGSATLAAGRLAMKNLFGIFTPFIIMGGAVALTTGTKIVPEQIKMANDIDMAINMREQIQGLENDTQDVYDNELDNFTLNLEGVEDLEIEIPEDLEIPADGGAAAGTVTPPVYDPLLIGGEGEDIKSDEQGDQLKLQQDNR